MQVRVVQIFLLIMVLGAGLYFATRQVEHVALEVRAPQELELGLPVYAQFVVAQTLLVEELIDGKALVVPMNISVVAQPLYVRLYRNERLVEEWKLPSDSFGVTDVSFPLDEVLLDGDLEVVFDGSEISHEDRDSAPRVFIEKDDFAYAGGSYRVAENEKEGDVALRIVAEAFVWEEWYRRLEGKPFELLAQLVFIVLGLTLLWQIPRILGRTN